MTYYSTVNIKDSIATKLLKIVFSFYFILTLAVTLFHMLAEYRYTKENIINELSLFEKTFGPGIANSLWDMNMDQLRSIYSGMIRFPIVIGVRVEDGKGREIGAVGIFPIQNGNMVSADHKANQEIMGLFEYRFPVMFSYEGITEKMGETVIYSNSSVVFERVQLGFLFIIVNAIIKTFFLWIIFLMVSQRLLTRPLSILTASTEQLDPDALEQIHIDIGTSGRNELKVLEQAFNTMIRKLASAQKNIRSYAEELKNKNEALSEAMSERIRAQDALRKLNEELEQRVEKRTDELAQANAEIITLNDYLKDALVRSEKMAELGQLIAGVGHEIKTPLGAIRASVDNISHYLPHILEQLPKLFQLLSEDLQNVFFVLLKRSELKQSGLSAKQERKLKRALIATLEEQNFDNADDIADTLVDMGIYDNIDPFLLLFRNIQCRLIMKTAYNLTGLKRNSLNIANAVDRASKIVTALKSYAHYDHAEEMTESDLAEGIETVLILFHNQIKQGIEVIRDYEQMPPVPCYPDELNQVWSNLIHNAIQSMEGSGTLKIDVCRKNDRVVVAITDSGKGIPDEVRQRIFEPFFTTKPRGEGSGLGLDIVRKIIDKHKGEIEVESEPGRTVFSVILRFGRETFKNKGKSG